ncbi:acyl-CoA thioesterase [Psychroflexus salis]|uniref:Thioesterase n=1 Tax=Psychroflexus salis TaxID=1526574 RepID=A0A917E822_9FLAO|nr:thioesterase family protein [Psychroflexus salis]GGE12395.1 thioesterase [Psychroflexus salis]
MTKLTKTKIEVRYAETDQMGVVHHGIYPQYLELGRLDWLNQFGLHYQKMEEQGVMLPVYNLQISYLASAKFGDTLKVETLLKEKPNVRIIFTYKIYNLETKQLLVEATTTLVFVDSKTRKPMRCPSFLLSKFGY